MKKGFTLLELVVVIIILGVLATLGIQQYGRMVERSRGAEARTILGQIRSTAAAYRLQNGTVAGFAAANAGIGAAADQIPTACVPTHYFSYAVTTVTAPDSIVLTATRCVGATGRVPGAATATTLTLTTNFGTGVDTWGGTGGY